MEGKKWVGVTRLIFCTPSSINFSNNSRSRAELIGMPTPPWLMGSFWQKAQPRVQPEKNTVPLPKLPEITGSSQFAAMLYEYKVGDTVTITVLRGNETKDLTVVLGERS